MPISFCRYGVILQFEADELQISAFSPLPNENDIECGREASSFIRSSMSRFLFSVT